MKRTLVTILAASFLLGATGVSHAIVTDWTIDHSPVLLGETITCKAVSGAPAAQIRSIKWEVQGVTKNGTLTTWADLQLNSSSINMTMVAVDRINIRLTAKYMSMPGGPPAPSDTVITHYVDVQRPDSDPVVAGLNTPTALDQTGQTRVDVKFEMRAGSKPIGPQFIGYVQEDLLSWEGFNPITNTWINITYTPGWDPPPGQASTVFTRVGNSIIDRKYAWCDPGWYALIPLYSNFQKVTQKNRLVAMNWAYEEVPIEFPSHDFELRKSGTNTWTLEE